MPILDPPVRLALAQPARTVPDVPGWWIEPKYDGWRGCLHVERGVLHSRSGANLSRRFPEILRAACRQLGDVVLDGELVALRGGRLDFAALQSAPSRRVAEGVAIHFMVFDLLARDDRDLRQQSYRTRRALLEQVLKTVRSPIALTPATADRQGLAWINPDFAGVGIEGVVAKHADSRYLGDRRDWIKVRHQERVDAVLIGVTGTVGHPNALVLAQSDGHGHLRAVGLSLPLSRAIRTNLAGRLAPIAGIQHATLPGVVGGLPGQPAATYVPVHPDVVVEVEADLNVEFGRFRHRPRVLRIRVLFARADVCLVILIDRKGLTGVRYGLRRSCVDRRARAAPLVIGTAPGAHAHRRFSSLSTWLASQQLHLLRGELNRTRLASGHHGHRAAVGHLGDRPVRGQSTRADSLSIHAFSDEGHVALRWRSITHQRHQWPRAIGSVHRREWGTGVTPHRCGRR